MSFVELAQIIYKCWVAFETIYLYIYRNNQIVVMIQEVRSKTQFNSNKDQKIKFLQFENQILTQRNQILSDENKKMIEQIESMKIQSLRFKDINNLTKQAQDVAQEIEICYKYLIESLNLLGKSKELQKFHTKKKFINNQSENIKQLSIILKEISQEVNNSLKSQKTTLKKEKFQQIEDRLKMRKESRIEATKIVHLVKDPSFESQQFGYDWFKQNFSTVHEFFMNIVSRVKKQNVSLNTVQRISEQIKQYIQLKWKLKKQSNSLKSLQRKLQLGKIQNLDFQETVQKYDNTRDKIEKKKLLINQNVMCLGKLR